MNTTLVYISLILGIIALAIIDWKIITQAVREYEQQTKEQGEK